MTNPVQLREAIHPIQNSLRPSSWRCRSLLIALTLGCFGLSPQARAVCQDGCNTYYNTFLGDDALINNTTGAGNTALGFNALYSNIDGSQNTATGSGTLPVNTTGDGNTATGTDALHYNTSGSYNTATGANALWDNTTGSYNTADGYQALHVNTTGAFNTAVGYAALTGYNDWPSSFTSSYNTAVGASALAQLGDNSGSFDGNTGLGALVLLYMASGSNNTATGAHSIQGDAYSRASGSNNTANGASSLRWLTSGSNNVAQGYNALLNNTTGGSNIAVGESAGINLTTGSNNIDIGNAGVAGESNKIRIGKQGTQTNTFIAGISGVTVPSGVGVIVGTNGKLGTVVSSERFKEEIQLMDKTSEAILALKPVTFCYKHELDPDGIPQFGLVAEEVEKVNPDLVARDDQGKPYSVRYEAVNAMLLNEFLKAHRKEQKQDAMIAELKSAVAQQQQEIRTLTSGLKEQASKIQKVSARLTVSKAAPQLADTN